MLGDPDSSKELNWLQEALYYTKKTRYGDSTQAGKRSSGMEDDRMVLKHLPITSRSTVTR